MGRRFAIAILFQIACIVLAGCPQSSSSQRGGPPQRIVLIVIDMLRQDHVGVYGGAVRTPHMDALAAQGQAFPNAIASFPFTTMSMGALFTGRTPSIETGNASKPAQWNGSAWCGLGRFSADGSDVCIPEGVGTLAERLRSAGYETLGVASNVLLYAPAGFQRGFDVWEEPGQRTSEPREEWLRAPRISRGAYGGTLWPSVVSAVRRVLEARRTNRFFLYVHLMDAHDFREQGISYAEGVERADAGVGAVLETLRKDGLLDDALVFLTSDHGERLGEQHPVPGRRRHLGNPAFDYLLRVPLIVAPKILGDPGRLIRGQDLTSLVLEQAGASLPDSPELAEEEVFFSEWEWQTLRTPRWKAMFPRTEGRALLFDLERDPAEQTDVAALHPETLATMRARTSELTDLLAVRGQGRTRASEKDLERLRAIGYIEAAEQAASSDAGP